ncbi:energy transducer TonB [Chlorobium ferrooxidans]|uniref:TonB-like n=1 Tax=Chlorobium ferrooxidans DSM 13031 TaxID=377431 RepID=Q0YV16_9CHLB|nr:energy transducer TonB [Chlorobium ferrooxidans]EAT59880.1 TonB-like [Chlorobium ferrooxidans DSM 13031]
MPTYAFILHRQVFFLVCNAQKILMPVLCSVLLFATVNAEQYNLHYYHANGSSLDCNPSFIGNKSLERKGLGSEGSSSSTDDEVPICVPSDKMPGFLDQKKPVYPEIARIEGITGKLFVNVLIGKDGRPEKVKVMKRIPPDCYVFDEVAIKSVMESTYSPAILNGRPIKVWMTVPIKFQFD